MTSHGTGKFKQTAMKAAEKDLDAAMQLTMGKITMGKITN